MPAYVNSGNTRGPARRLSDGAWNPNYGDAPESRINCALCTAAVLAGAGTSGDVNVSLQTGVHPRLRWGPFESDEAFIIWRRVQPGYLAAVGLAAADLDLTDQVDGVSGWLTAQGRTLTQRGAVGALETLANARTWMAARANGAQFAVYINSLNLGGAHWLVARNNAGTVEFCDYQMSTTESPAVPPWTANPSCGDNTTNSGNCIILESV